MTTGTTGPRTAAGLPPVAIVGMACLFPGAADLATYWRNIVEGVDAVGDPPADWGADHFFDPGSTSNDRIYTQQGGWLGELARFDPVAHGVMPNSVAGGEPDQFLALEIAHRALGDAGGAGAIPDRSRAGVIIGRGTYINRSFTNVLQHGLVIDQTLQLLAQLHPEHTDEELQAIKAELKAGLPPFNAEMAPGLVPNVMSGRIANRLDLMGPNYTIDAACASSLVAVDLAIQELSSGRCDLMLVGGVHASTPAPILQIFCQLEALSRSGRIRPFDERADGTLLGEGLGFVVLKRHDDAVRDGDREYALIRSVGVASDGRAQGLLAPRAEGEELALRRAYAAAAVDPATVQLIEAHGTGTPVGDATEIAALTAVLGARAPAGPTVALGTVKSMISHLIPASGMAGLIKTALALHERVLPPTLHCEQVNPALGLERSTLYLNTVTRPWVHGGPEPRRAGVDSFGFGGINTHAVLEEAPGSDGDVLFPRTGAPEVVVLDAQSRSELRDRCELLSRTLDEEQPLPLAVEDLRAEPASDPPERLTLVVSSVADLRAKLTRAAERLADPDRQRLWERSGIFYVAQPLARGGRVALLFPGEGSQYAGMLADVVMAVPSVRRWFDLVDRAFQGHHRGFPPSHAVYPPPGDPTAEALIWRMDVGPESLFAASQGLLALLRDLGLGFDAVLGHSTGEWSALVAAGALPIRDDDSLVADVAALNRLYERLEHEGALSRAVLLSVGGAGRGAVDEALARSDGGLALALDNCPSQVVLCGDEEAASAAETLLSRGGAVCERLPFERPYHTPAFDDFARQVRAHLGTLTVQEPVVDVYSCRTAATLPRDPDAIRDLAAEQWAHPVRFRETVERMYRDGVRVFVEVGPRANLTAFVDDILRGRPHLAAASDAPGGSLAELAGLVAKLLAHRVPLSRAQLRPGGPSTGPAGPGRAGQPLPTSLQPLHLQIGAPRRAAPVVVNGSGVVGAARADGAAADAAPVPAQGPTSDRERVMQLYLRTMGRFLDVQADVMRSVLAGHEATAPRWTATEAAQPLELTAPVPAAAVPELGALTEHAAPAAAVSELGALNEQAAPAVSDTDPDADLDLTAELRELLRDRTGYPEELLHDDLDLEADLGIDSIKRVEILGVLRERLGLPAGTFAALRSRRTIQTIVAGIEEIVGAGGGSSTVPDAPDAPSPRGSARVPVTDLPFVDEVLEHRPGERLVARCDWDTARDPCLLDHTIERAAVSRRDGSRVGLPVVPLTLSLELLAEVGCAFAGGGVVTALTDVVAHRWTSLPEGRRAVLATAEPGRAAGAVAVSVEDAGEPSAPLLSATVHVAAGYPPAPDPVPGPTGPRPDPGVAFYGADGLFHGPRFQVVRSLDSVSADAATATLTSRGPREVLGDRRGSLATDPALLDGPGQVLARWLATQQRDGLDIFPVRLDALRLFAPPPPAGARFGCRLKVTETEPARLRTDLELVDDGGRLTARFSGWEDVRVTLPERFRDFLGRPAEAFLSDRWTPAGDALREGAGRRLPGLAPEVLGYGGLWLGVLAHCVLAPEERSDWHRLAAAPTRRRAQWLCGRIAAKEALRDLLAAAGEPDWADADIMIATGPGGRPVVAGSWPLAGSAPSISIAHTDGMVVAVARPAATGAVGVDVQAVGTVPAAAEHLAFDDWERTWLTGVDPGDRALRATELWCAKEAAAKAVGSGVPLPPSALGVRVELQDRGLLATVAVAGLATGGVGGPDDREPALVTVVEDGGFVYALCSWGDQAPVGSTPAMGGRS